MLLASTFFSDPQKHCLPLTTGDRGLDKRLDNGAVCPEKAVKIQSELVGSSIRIGAEALHLWQQWTLGQGRGDPSSCGELSKEDD